MRFKSTQTPLMLVLALVMGLWSNYAYSATPKVVVTILPLYELMGGIMEGVGTPELLVPVGASEHDYALKPSQISELHSADLIVWIGPSLETFLIKTVDQLQNQNQNQNQTQNQNKNQIQNHNQDQEKTNQNLKPAHILTLEDIPTLKKYSERTGALWGGEAHGHSLTFTDPHLWLDPTNASQMVQAMTDAIIQVDEAHRDIYEKNNTIIQSKLKKLDTEIAKALQGYKNKPYIVYHDAYQYYEKRYGLQGAGAITPHPENPISPKRIQTIHDMITKGDIQCVFTEPQFQPTWINTLVSGGHVKMGVLDPLGSDVVPRFEGYENLLKNMTQSFTTCLSAP